MLNWFADRKINISHGRTDCQIRNLHGWQIPTAVSDIPIKMHMQEDYLLMFASRKLQFRCQISRNTPKKKLIEIPCSNMKAKWFMELGMMMMMMMMMMWWRFPMRIKVKPNRIPRITLQFIPPPHSQSQGAYEVGSLVKVVTRFCGLCKVDIKAAYTTVVSFDMRIILTCLYIIVSFLFFISTVYRSSSEWQGISQGLTDHLGISWN